MAFPNLGTGGATLNGTNNGATRLAHDGTTNYVYLPGVNGNYLSTPDVAALDITGDIDLRVKVALDDWTPAAEGYLLSKWSSGQQSYILAVTTGGNLRLYWTTNGSTNILRTSTVALGLANGAVKWVRATLDVDNGASGHDAKFWTSDDGSSWTQLGTTVTTAGTTSIWSGSAQVEVGTHSSGTAATGGAGKHYRAQVYSGIGGTLVLDVDTSVITSGAATSFQSVDSSPKTVTVNRATSGKKACAVTASCWLLGTDDYIEVPDNADLDFAASDSFTVLAVHRAWATFGTNDVLVAKKADTTATTQGWALTAGSSTAAQGQGQIGDGTNGTTAVSGSRTSGAVSVVATVRNVTADTLTTYLNGVAGTPVTDPTTGTFANSEVVRVGRLSGAGTEYADMELLAVAVWRRALTAAEIDLVTTRYQARWP